MDVVRLMIKETDFTAEIRAIQQGEDETEEELLASSPLHSISIDLNNASFPEVRNLLFELASSEKLYELMASTPDAPMWKDIEEKYQYSDRGASFGLYEFLLNVSVGVAGGIATHYILILKDKILKRIPTTKDETYNIALESLSARTSTPKSHFNLMRSSEIEGKHKFLFEEKNTKKKYLLVIYQDVHIEEFRVYEANISDAYIAF